MRVYLDSAPVIYLAENVQPLAADVMAFLSGPDTELVASDLTRLECRVKPLRDNRPSLLEQYDLFFGAIHEIVPLSAHVMDSATRIRAELGFRTPDAIHIAAALYTKADVFLTNDHRLDRPLGLKIQVVERPGPAE